jgi:hypothetical protein
MCGDSLKVPCTYSLGDAAGVEVFHQFDETRLCFLRCHGCAFYGADLLLGDFLFGYGQGVDVIEDIGWFFDVECRARQVRE